MVDTKVAASIAVVALIVGLLFYRPFITSGTASQAEIASTATACAVGHAVTQVSEDASGNVADTPCTPFMFTDFETASGETQTGTALTNSTAYTFTAVAGETYLIHANLIAKTSATGTGLKLQLHSSTGASYTALCASYTTSALLADEFNSCSIATSDVTGVLTITLGVAATPISIILTARAVTPNTGTVVLAFAANTAGQTATLQGPGFWTVFPQV